MANAIGNNGGRMYSFAGQPVLIDCNFIVDSTNGNGLGIRALKGQGVKAVYMATSASFTGTVHSGTNVIDSISGGTSSLKVGMPISGTDIPAGATITGITSSTAITMSALGTGSPGSETIYYVGVGNKLSNTGVATTSEGLAWIQLKSNYHRYLGGFSGFVSPPTGSPLGISSGSAALTVGSPYTIYSVGHGPAGVVTIAPVADSSGSLASTYFMLFDSYGNSFCIWFSVSGVGSPPNLGPGLSPAQLAAGARGLTYVQQTISTNATADNITTALALTIPNLPSGIQGTYSFTVSGGGTATLTCTSTANLPVAGVPQDGTTVIPQNNSIPVPITFTISTGSATAGSIWTDGNGNLFTVASTVSSGTSLKTTGVNLPVPSSGTLTYVSGPGSTSSLTYSAAIAGQATGFTFAQTVSDTNLGDWEAVGVPKGLTPTPNLAFVAAATGAGGSTGTALAVGVSGITSIEVVGDVNQSIAPLPQGGSSYVGGWILVQFLAATSSSVTTLVPTAPANNSVVGMSFYVDAKDAPSNYGGL